jgi:hypothetical protein
MQKRMLFAIGVLVLIVGLAPIASAEDDKPTNDEIAKELANPNTALTSLKFQFQFQFFSFDGDLPRADNQDMFKLFLQPTLPFPLENGKTIWVRPGVPLVMDQPVYDSGSRRIGTADGLGRWMCSTAQSLKTAFSGVSDSRRCFPRPPKMNWAADSGPWGPAFSLASFVRSPFTPSSLTTSGISPVAANQVPSCRSCGPSRTRPGSV